MGLLRTHPSQSSMTTSSERCLLSYENLSLPSVIVMTADMGCNSCRKRASYIISKMTGVRDITVDVVKNQVTVTADFRSTSRQGEVSASKPKQRDDPIHSQQSSKPSQRLVSTEISPIKDGSFDDYRSTFGPMNSCTG
ncbi:uncharacterized protein LOC116193066 isoform X2 [Punica granatum]|uniref:Uncharacterized protein LOC116193066 isoform X2 n=2 Tax=Punica granatum TaxID=22663 RepID=A0A6P8C9E8_PUNGR|nr:uncharacterized protein LOC116193066 isoform X2 [Punica granatum]PKI39818.1 hypothetical protein CRG98_039863 [Punica granatum]